MNLSNLGFKAFVSVLSVNVLFLFVGAAFAELEWGPGGKPVEIVGGTTPVAAFITVDGAEILEGPDPKSKVIRRAKFLTPYYVAKAPVKGRKGLFVLLATSGKATEQGHYKIKEIVGWVKQQNCLISRTAIKNKFGIYRKALIVNDPQRMKKDAEKSQLKAVTIYNGPGKRSDGSAYKKLSTIGLYDFFYIYAEVKRNKSTFFLLGERPEIVSQRKPQEAILGWVSNERIFRWDTRQAIEFNKSNLSDRIKGLPVSEQGVKIFSKKKELEYWLKGIKSPPGSKETIQPVAQEDVKVSFWRYNWPRYPILGAQSQSDSKHGKLLQIGFIGDMIYLDSDKKGMKAQGVADSIQTIDKLKKKLRNIELFFVIDSTGSMSRYFASAAQAVRTITEKMNAAYDPGDPNKPKIRYSVLFYRDYGDEGKPNSYLTKRLPLTQDTEKVVEFLTNEPEPPSGAGGDEPEAVYHGIYTAVNDAQDEMIDFSFRAAILIGDKGNHLEDIKGYDAAKVARFLKENQVDFYAIHVAEQEQLWRDPDVGLFRDQVSILYAQLKMAMNVSYYVEMEPEQVAQSIVTALERVKRDSDRVALMADDLQRGRGFKELKKQYGLRLTEKFAKMMNKAGLSPEFFVNNSIQVFGQGWVSDIEPKNKLSQIQEVVLTNRTDFEVMVGYVAGFVRKRPTKENVRKLWSAVLRTNLGEFDSRKTVAELIQNQVGLPIRMKLLHKTLDQISNISPGQLAKLYDDLNLDLRKMRGVLAEQDLAVERVDGRFKVKRLGFHRYWWEAHGQEFAWIPLTLLP